MILHSHREGGICNQTTWVGISEIPLSSSENLGKLLYFSASVFLSVK